MSRITPFLTIILGFTGTGKTTHIQRIIEQYTQKKNRVQICTPYDVEWCHYEANDISIRGFYKFEGVRRYVTFSNPVENLTKENNYFRNGLLILDDCKFYLDNVTDAHMKRLLIGRKQRGIDIIIAAHGFTEVPPRLFTFANYIILHKTNDNIKNRKNVLRNYDEMVKHQIEVNENKDFHHYKVIKML